MKKHWALSSLVVAGLFCCFVIWPFIWNGFPTALTTTYKGILQPTSLLYIVGSFTIYWLLSRQYEEEDEDYLLSTEQIQEMSRSVKLTAEIEEQDEKIDTLLSLVEREKASGIPYSKVVTAIQHGLGPDSIRLISKQLIETSAKKPLYMSRYWNQVAATMPLLGMTGTIAGLLFMFSDGGTDAGSGSQLAGLGVALLTTLYASLFTVLWAKPLAKQQADQVEEILNFGTTLSNYGQKLILQIFPHDFENRELQKRDVNEPGVGQQT